ncbi:MAG: NAD(P)-dependent oxidoreductase, partial [Sphingobacteriaceae bacterium]
NKCIFFYFEHPVHELQVNELLESDIVVYCAAAGVQSNNSLSNSLIYELNTFLPIKIFDILNANNFAGKWISFGSYFEIGVNNSMHYFNENEIISSLFAAPNSYCVSKRLHSRFMFDNKYSLKWFHLILPTIYGKEENKNRLLHYIVNSLKVGIIPKLSFGKQIRQYLHAYDLVRLIETLFSNSVESGIYNVACGDTVSISEIAKLVFSRFKCDVNEALGLISTRDDSMDVLLLNSSKLINSVQWHPLIKIESGIDEYIG